MTAKLKLRRFSSYLSYVSVTDHPQWFFLAGLTCCCYERAGQWYETYARRRLRQHTLSTSDIGSSDSDGDDSDGDLDEDNEEFLRTLDPKDWKVCMYTWISS